MYMYTVQYALHIIEFDHNRVYQLGHDCSMIIEFTTSNSRS